MSIDESREYTPQEKERYRTERSAIVRFVARLTDYAKRCAVLYDMYDWDERLVHRKNSRGEREMKRRKKSQKDVVPPLVSEQRRVITSARTAYLSTTQSMREKIALTLEERLFFLVRKILLIRDNRPGRNADGSE